MGFYRHCGVVQDDSQDRDPAADSADSAFLLDQGHVSWIGLRLTPNLRTPTFFELDFLRPDIPERRFAPQRFDCFVPVPKLRAVPRRARLCVSSPPTVHTGHIAVD
jgi:hypothetical protein